MATHGFGTTFSWDDVVIAELTTINGIAVTADTVEVSTHQSAQAFKEFIAGMLEMSDVTLEGYYAFDDTTGQHAMLVDMKARAAKEFIITFPSSTGTSWTADGFITLFAPSVGAIDGPIPFAVTIKPTGVPSFAVATSTGLTTPFFAISESAVITPDPAGATLVYVATVLTGITSVTLTPTAAAGAITVNGSTVATGVASSAITLGAAGTNTVITVIVTETDKAPVTYTITVARAAS